MPKFSSHTPERVYASRRKKVLSKLRSECALFPAASLKTRSRDIKFPFEQEKNFFYLTGFEEPDAVLLLRGVDSGPRTVLFLRDRDPQSESWEGERLGVQRARNRFKIDEVRKLTDFEKELPKLLRSCRCIHYAPGVNHQHDDFIWSFLKTEVGPSGLYPSQLKDIRHILNEMRASKDRFEIQAMRHAASISTKAFLRIGPELSSFSSELNATQRLESYFTRYGSPRSAFPSIIASGKHATVLHHRPTLQPLFKKDLVLIDAGAQFSGYASDLSRVFPASGSFSSAQADVYDIVYRTLQACVARAKPGVTFETLHNLAVAKLSEGLAELGIIKDTPSNIIEKKLYQTYFPHSLSHHLGLDTHDAYPLNYTKSGKLISHRKSRLQSGNVITIEPGLYFPANDKKIPAAFRGIGIRLEDDVLITPKGNEVLSKNMPVERADIESLCRG